jgi:hypothetical protein
LNLIPLLTKPMLINLISFSILFYNLNLTDAKKLHLFVQILFFFYQNLNESMLHFYVTIYELTRLIN